MISDILNPTPWKPSHAWSFWVENIFVTVQVEKAITESEGCRVMRKFIRSRNYLSNSKLYMINWDSIEIAITPKTVLFSLWVTKFLSAFCVTSKVLHWCNLKEYPIYPC